MPKCGGPCGGRTHDTRIKSPVLCQTELTARDNLSAPEHWEFPVRPAGRGSRAGNRPLKDFRAATSPPSSFAPRVGAGPLTWARANPDRSGGKTQSRFTLAGEYCITCRAPGKNCSLVCRWLPSRLGAGLKLGCFRAIRQPHFDLWVGLDTQTIRHSIR